MVAQNDFFATTVHVLLPDSVRNPSPSGEDGIQVQIEHEHRFFGCELIQEAGILLRCPQVVMATAQTMLQRFYYRKSLRDFDSFRVAIACLFLAAKVEERPKRIRDVLSVFYAIYRRRKWKRNTLHHQLLDPDSSTYAQWREWLILVERQLLIDLGFSIYNIAEHPHKYVLYYIKILDGSNELAQRAWGYINDSLRIDLCVRYSSQVIACAAIFLASRMLQVKLPTNPSWYKVFNVEKCDLYAVSKEIMALYKREKVEWLEPLTEVNPFVNDDHPEVEEERAEVELSAKELMKEQSSPQEPSSLVDEQSSSMESGDTEPIAPAKNDVEAKINVAQLVAETKVKRNRSPEVKKKENHRDDGDRSKSPSRTRRTRRNPSRSRSEDRDRQRRCLSRDRSRERRRRRSRSRSRSVDRRDRRRRKRSDSRSPSHRRRYR